MRRSIESCGGLHATDRQEVDAAHLIQEPDSEKSPSLVVQVEQLLGEGTEPDPLFFFESWTIGAQTAANHLRKRLNSGKVIDDITGGTGQVPNDPQALLTEQPTESSTWFGLLAWCGGKRISSPTSPGPTIEHDTHPPAYASYLTDTFDTDRQKMLSSPEPLTLSEARRLLGVTSKSSGGQIRAAFRELATLYHPDRFECGSESLRLHATKRMAKINEAHRLLCLELLRISKLH